MDTPNVLHAVEDCPNLMMALEVAPLLATQVNTSILGTRRGLSKCPIPTLLSHISVSVSSSYFDKSSTSLHGSHT
jgi:hypothetical protein